jgi:hypothetical protein
MGNDGTISMTWRSFPDGLWTWLSPIPANIRKKFRRQTSDNIELTDKTKQQTCEESEKRKGGEKRSEAKKSQKKAGAGARKIETSQKTRTTVFLHCFVASTLAKAAGAEPSGKMGDQKLHAIV